MLSEQEVTHLGRNKVTHDTGKQAGWIYKQRVWASSSRYAPRFILPFQLPPTVCVCLTA